MRNLIFVGLPGSGKSTVGRLAARTLGLPFVDADKALEQAEGRSIPDIFAAGGENVRYAAALRLLQGLVRVHEGKPQGPGRQPAHGAFAAAGQAHENQVSHDCSSRLRAISVSYSRSTCSRRSGARSPRLRSTWASRSGSCTGRPQAAL